MEASAAFKAVGLLTFWFSCQKFSDVKIGDVNISEQPITITVHHVMALNLGES
jgi:hypothetical protein